MLSIFDVVGAKSYFALLSGARSSAAALARRARTAAHTAALERQCVSVACASGNWLQLERDQKNKKKP